MRPFALHALFTLVASRLVKATGVSEAVSALNGLMSMYNPTSGLWDLTNNHAEWWQSAIALQAILDFMKYTDTYYYMPIANFTINTQRAPVPWWPQGGGNFRAGSTDDTGWWALALLSKYAITGERWLLDIAVADEAYMSQYWTTQCNGGLIWRIQDTSYKAAISNELLIELTATLHNLIPGDETYLGKSLLAWEWFKQSGMINTASLINDGLMPGAHDTCVNNGAPTWTYNQGVILGGLIQLHKATGDGEFINVARRIADAVITSSHLAPQGILTEPCQDCVDADQHSFKGIFIRYLSQLNEQLDDRPYGTFISRNADTAFATALSTDEEHRRDLYGMSWQGPFDKNTLGAQESAIMLLTAALHV
jgi:predicted alpha-1,6-mannanase (GH76 family)